MFDLACTALKRKHETHFKRAHRSTQMKRFGNGLWGGIKNWPNRAVKRRTSLLSSPVTDLKDMVLYNSSTNTNIKIKNYVFFRSRELGP